MMIDITTIKELMTDDNKVDDLIGALQLRTPHILTSDKLRKEGLRDYLKHLREDIFVIVEDDYIDKVYRNIYSHYLSTKLNQYTARCLKLSFLKTESGIPDIINGTIAAEDLHDEYLGFMVLRPTYPGIVGRSAIDPRALNYSTHIMVCTAPIGSSVCGLKTVVRSFPHSSQDTEYSTCAETSIWSVMEYFGNKYPEYSPILPSQIHELIDVETYERHIPSHGLRYMDISFVLKSLGFGCKVYSLATKDEPGFTETEFYRIFSTYVESGIPMVAAVSGTDLGHAIVCIGQEETDRKNISNVSAQTFKKSGKTYRLWADVKRKFVFNDDNKNAYSLNEYSCPTPKYKGNNPKIASLIVPLYNKLYLDAPRLIEIAPEFCDDVFFDIPDDTIIRSYLTSGRTYRDFMMRDRNVDEEVKGMLVENASFPKFIWVIEISTFDSFINGIVDGLLVVDPTEPMKYENCFPLIACFDKNFSIFDLKLAELKKKSLTSQFKLSSFDNLNTF